MDAGFELGKIKEYIKRNVIRAREGRKCVDGRYLPTQASGMIARPGGDMGYVMALLAVNKRKNLRLTPEECFDEVYKVVIRTKGRFYMHTDHHAESTRQADKVFIGCGHLAKAASENLSREYGLDGEDVERVIAYARKIADKTQAVEIVNLEGEHEEAGILVIHSEQYSVNSQDLILDKMYFVYDVERDVRFLRDLVLEMAIPGVDFAEMKNESDLQLQATLHNLASGLPIYNVIFRGGTPSISFDSFVK